MSPSLFSVFLFVTFLSVLLFPAPSVYADFGESGWTIFNKAQSARFRAISAASPVAGDLSGVFYNPAVLGTDKRKEIFFLSELGASEDKLGGVVYGQPLKNGMLAIGAVYFDAGMMELNWIDDFGNILTENVTAQRDIMGLVSYGHRFSDKFYGGVTAKAATSEIAQRDSAFAYAGDAGILFSPANGLYLAAAVQNAGGSTKFTDKTNPLPTSGYVGGGYGIKHGSLSVFPAAGVTYDSIDKEVLPEAGVELGFGLLSLNAGYRFNVSESNFHIGLGLNTKNFDFGYAYIPGVYLNASHRFSVGMKL